MTRFERSSRPRERRGWSTWWGIRLSLLLGTALAVGAAPFVADQVAAQDAALPPPPPPPAPKAAVPADEAPPVPPPPLAARKAAEAPKEALGARPGPAAKKVEIVVKKKAVEKAAVKAAPAMVINANLNAMNAQWRQQFRPLLRVEYQFVRSICEPTKEQRIPIAGAGLKALDEAAEAFNAWQLNPNGLRAQQRQQPDVRSLIQKGLETAAKKHLSAAQFDRFRRELDARASEQKRTAILIYLSRLDQLLVLRPEQIKQIEESITSGWDESWGAPLRAAGNIPDSYLPMVEEQLVVKFLNDQQRTIWTGISKINLGTSMGFMVVDRGDGPLDDEFSDDEAKAAAEPKATPKQEPKP